MKLETVHTQSLKSGAHISRTQPFDEAVSNFSRLVALTENDRPEVLEFLALRPVHTVVMTSFIRDNGLEASADNRGRFFGYRNRAGQLEGVALIGHTTLIESRSPESLLAFAMQARLSETPIHLLMSDGTTVQKFWKLFALKDQKPRLVCTELLFELSFPFMMQDCKWEVRLAQTGELDQIAEAHAEVAFVESGVNPLEKDREGFLKRTLRRIEKERTFVVFDRGRLVFKADIVAETDEVAYLEGIYVAPEYRGQNVAASCLSKLSLELLNRVSYISMLSNVELKNAHRCFFKAGFKNTDRCETIFV